MRNREFTQKNDIFVRIVLYFNFFIYFCKSKSLDNIKDNETLHGI